MYYYLGRLGNFGYLIYQLILSLRFIVRDRERIVYQTDKIGVEAIPIVLVVGIFAGTTIAWQAAYQFRGMAPLSLLGGQVTKTIMMEMAPVLTALVMSGRVGASMTAEIGGMKITEQIDALKTMSIDPVRYIVLPRFIALCLMMPVLGIFSMAIAVAGALTVCVLFLDISSYSFLNSVRDLFSFKDMAGGLVKTFFFGAIISLIGCYKGLETTGGTKGIGEATISSFVFSAISILISDFLLWIILF
ncbi:MAG: ABC transporter permease [Bacteroidia bacterium]|nr:ABC transporter permease [Bacteroidia bacterium]